MKIGRKAAPIPILGLKWRLFDQEGLRPDFAIIPAMVVPTGGGFSSGDVDPEIKLAWGYDLTDRLALADDFFTGAGFAVRF